MPRKYSFSLIITVSFGDISAMPSNIVFTYLVKFICRKQYLHYNSIQNHFKFKKRPYSFPDICNDKKLKLIAWRKRTEK